MKKMMMKTFRKFMKAWKKIPWGKIIQLEPIPPTPKFRVNWPSGPAYEAKGRIGKFIEFMKANIEVEPIPPVSKPQINWPSGPSYEAMSSFGKFTEICRQNIQFYQYNSSSFSSSCFNSQSFSTGIMNTSSTNLSHSNPASGLPMINSCFDASGNAFGSSSLSGMSGISTSSITGISNNGMF